MVSFPPCKINLGLQVIAKRPDGYHDLLTCFYPLPWTDVVEVLPFSRMEFSITGMTIPGPASENLCLKAYRLLKEDFNIPSVQFHLHKIIPAGAGLGGGSSDAAHVIRMLNQVFSLGLTQARMMQYAALIGSDCAFFIQDQPMIGSSRGEVLAPAVVSLKGYYLVLVNPGIHVSTALAYQGVRPAIPENDLQAVLTLPVREWRGRLKNDFETSVFQRHPAIGSVKEQFYDAGAVYASMSGSGSSVYGIFEKEPDSPRLFNGLPCWSGRL